jgi:hypothetical protein
LISNSRLVDVNNNNNCLSKEEPVQEEKKEIKGPVKESRWMPEIRFFRNPIYSPGAARSKTPAPVPAPVVTSEMKEQVAEEQVTPLDQLRAMGFTNVELNKEMLAKNNNDLVAAISELLLQ